MTVTRLARAAAIVAVLGLVSRLLGFVREAVLAAAFGASADADAFVSGLLLVNSVAAVLLYTLVTLVIPVFQQEEQEHGATSAWRLLAALAGWIGLGLFALSMLALLWPEGPAALFGFDDERAATTAELIRIMAPALAMQGFSALFTAMLQVHRKFAGPAAVGVAFNAGIIAGVLIGQETIGIRAAAWGVTIGAAMQVALQLPQFVRLLRANHVRPAIWHPRLAWVGGLALPVLAASILQQVNNFTDKLFAATLEDGRVAALSFANALGQAPRAALLIPLLTPLFPEIARLVAQGRESGAVRAFTRVAGMLGLVVAPVALLLALYSHEGAQLAFGRGACDAACVDEIASPLLFYGLALPAGFFSFLCNRTLSAGNQTRQIMVATIVTVALTIGLDIVLLGPLEQAGLALATAIALYVNALMLLIFLHRRFPEMSLARLGLQQGRLLVAALVATATALAANLVLPTGDASSLTVLVLVAVKVGVALVVYVAIVRLLAPEELREGRAALGALVRRRRAVG